MAPDDAASGVSRETIASLKRFEDLIRRWSKAINLVSPSTLDTLWSRHILDCLQIVDLLPTAPQRYVDFGSGAGLPGIVVAAGLSERGSDTEITLVESDKRKSAFLMTAARELGLRLNVRSERIESLHSLRADAISARALAPLTRLLAYQERHGLADCVGIYPKGTQVATEIEEALEDWRFTCERRPSKTSPDSTILMIGDLRRA